MALAARISGASHRNRLLSSLSAIEQQRLRPYLEEVELDLHETLCATGDPIRYLTFPHDAVTSTVVDLPEGDVVEVGLMGAEGVVGLDVLYGVSDSVSTVIVQVAGRGARIAADDFAREVMANGGEFYSLLLRYSHAFFGMVAQSGACNASHSIPQRLARWLLLVQDRVERDRFPLTHEFVALMLGVRRASVTEAATALRSLGAIEYVRGEVRIVRRDALESAACGCYEIMRKLGESMFAPPDFRIRTVPSSVLTFAGRAV